MRLKFSLQQEATWDLLFALFRSLTYEKRVPSSSIKTASFLLPFATNPWFPGPLVFISGTRSFLLLFSRWNPVEFWGFLLDLQKFMHLYPLNFFFFNFSCNFLKICPFWNFLRRIGDLEKMEVSVVRCTQTSVGKVEFPAPKLGFCNSKQTCPKPKRVGFDMMRKSKGESVRVVLKAIRSEISRSETVVDDKANRRKSGEKTVRDLFDFHLSFCY